MGRDPLDEEQRALVRKHGIPFPAFRAFLRVFAKRYRGKFSKYREKFRYRRPLSPDESPSSKPEAGRKPLASDPPDMG